MDIDLHLGDCLEVMRSLPDNSVDALVTDPPAGIAFMGLDFDHHRGGRDAWVAWLREILEECNRVMKPGAIGFVWSLPRTQHWTAIACEDAGFDIWDNLGVAHVHGGGFPKGQDISKLIDRRAGKLGDRAVVGEYRSPDGCDRDPKNRNKRQNYGKFTGETSYDVTAPATDEAERWDGWRSPAMKPAMEMWICVRAPFKGSCVDNVLAWGCGAINVDAGRVGAMSERDRTYGTNLKTLGEMNRPLPWKPNTAGRYPANFVLVHSPDCTGDRCAPECPCELLGEQGGICKPDLRTEKRIGRERITFGDLSYETHSKLTPDPGGTIARYFNQFDPPVFHYQAKASPRDRREGTEHLVWRRDKASSVGWSPCDAATYESLPDRDRARGNIHATVKSVDLCAHFVKLATPPGGVVLDPFAGSGTTGVACARLGFGFVGIEREPHYVAIARSRIDFARSAIAVPEPQPEEPSIEERVARLEFQQRAIASKVRRIEQTQLNLFG